MITFLNGLLPTIQSILLLATLIGGAFVFRGNRKTAIVRIQNDTITALQQQLDALKAGQEALEKENSRMEYIIETITMALEQKGIFISINGEMITLEDAKGQSSSIRRSTKQPPIIKKTETQ